VIVLIVDDETHVREGIKLLGEWEKHGITTIYEASNGEEATSLIEKHRPEIIFSDMKMPKMDGTKLLEWIKDHHSTSKVIVVTGYDDYHYMRKAIHFGSTDYLLKPVDPEILNQTLETAVNEWKKEEQERKKEESSGQLMNVMKPVYRDRKFTQLMNSDEGVDGGLFEELGFQASQSYTVGIIRVNQRTIEAFAGDRDLAYFTVLNVVNEIMMEKQCGIGFRYLSNKGEVVIIFWDRFDELEDILVHIYQSLHSTMSIACPIALGKMVEESSQLKGSYREARKVLVGRNLLEHKACKVYVEKVVPDKPLKSLMDYSSSIDLAIQAGEIEAFGELIDQVRADFTENHYLSVKQLLQFENEYLLLSNRWYKANKLEAKVSEDVEGRVDSFFDVDGNFRLDEYEAKKKREIHLFLRKIKKKASRKKTNIIEDIEAYLQANFDRDVKLQEISEHFYISREYISRKFKQEFKVNISDYIVAIRMKKAKSLLKNSQLKIYEIANMIGYQDDKYFRKVFKKVVGITPNEFRASLEGKK
jgi:two-component system, response regulator YesN